MKYVVGYDQEKGFITLYEGNNLRAALLMAKKIGSQKEGKIIKIKKRG